MSDSSKYFIAIAGNPNSGKTTAFNHYTGARQHVGNYPGITVEKKEGSARLDGQEVRLVDLPGTYSLTAYSLEEVVARNVIADERPGAVMDILNAGVLERNLYLTVQLLEMGVPVVLGLNMMDEARAKGLRIDTAKLKELTGLTAVPVVARTGEGMADLLRAAAECAEKTRGAMQTPLNISYGPDIDAALVEMTSMVERASLFHERHPSRWTALKFLERDEDIINRARALAPEATNALIAYTDKVSAHLKATQNTYPEGIIADYRYGFISSILRQGVLTQADKTREQRIEYSDKMDLVLTHRFFGPLILLSLLYFMYYVTFELGAYPADLLGEAFGWLSDTVNSAMPDGLLKSLIISGVIDGVGGVLGFVPLILIMFLFIAFLEDSGYMARVAYMTDRVFRAFGLHGASVMPFIISGGIAGGCAVPGVMAARTLRSPKERLATILTAPFMTCGAKMPVFLLFVGIFFQENQETVMFLLTIAGWLAALLTAKLLRSTILKGEATPFVMELPPYRMPTLYGVLVHTWERGWQYVKKAGTIILAISVILWAAMTFPGLPEDESAKYAERKAPIEEQLQATAYGALQAKIDGMKEELGGLPEGDAKAKTLAAEIAATEEEFGKLPLPALKAELEKLQGELEEAPKEDFDRLQAMMERLEAKASPSPADKAELEKLREQQAATEAGKLAARIAELEDAVAEAPETKFEEQIAEIDNEESGDALRHSIAGRIGIALEPVSKPAGFDWRTNIALVGGIAAKEVVVATLGTAYSLGEIGEDNEQTLADRIAADSGWTKANAIALLLFTLLYSPCFVTLVVIKNEAGGWRWMFFSLFFNLGVAWAAAVAANQILLRV